MLAILRDRTYRHLFAAQAIALLGTGLMTVALGLLTYDLAGADAGAVVALNPRDYLFSARSQLTVALVCLGIP